MLCPVYLSVSMLHNLKLLINNFIMYIDELFRDRKWIRSSNLPTLMTSFPLNRIINPFPIFSNTIHKKLPSFLSVPQKLLMFFSINLRLRTFPYHNLIIFLTPNFLQWRFRVTNRSNILQPKNKKGKPQF